MYACLAYSGHNSEVVSLDTMSPSTAGVKSLYYSCVECIAGMYEMYQPLLQKLLPSHIHTAIVQERDKKANVLHYRLVKL